MLKVFQNSFEMHVRTCFWLNNVFFKRKPVESNQSGWFVIIGLGSIGFIIWRAVFGTSCSRVVLLTLEPLQHFTWKRICQTGRRSVERIFQILWWRRWCWCWFGRWIFRWQFCKTFRFMLQTIWKRKKYIFVIVPGGLLLLSLEDVEDDSEPFLDFLNLVEYL